jgi:hypothetical protein
MMTLRGSGPPEPHAASDGLKADMAGAIATPNSLLIRVEYDKGSCRPQYK